MRTEAMKKTLLAVTMLFSGAVAVTSCSNQKDRPPVAAEAAEVGSVGLALQLANGATITSVHYKISGNGIGSLSVIADIDLDGVPEILTGNNAYKLQRDPASPTGFGSCVKNARFSAPKPSLIT